MEVNLATFDKPDTVASHVLVIMVRSIINPFKFSLANFSTTTATSSQLFVLFWKAVGISDYDKAAKDKMFISRQTHIGLRITAHSIVDCVKYMLKNTSCKYVLTERFCQDPLENYFGRQRSLGARKDNPTLRKIGYNDNSIRNQKVFRPIASGNCIDQGSVEISEESVPCRKKPRFNKSKPE